MIDDQIEPVEVPEPRKLKITFGAVPHSTWTIYGLDRDGHPFSGTLDVSQDGGTVISAQRFRYVLTPEQYRRRARKRRMHASRRLRIAKHGRRP